MIGYANKSGNASPSVLQAYRSSSYWCFMSYSYRGNVGTTPLEMIKHTACLKGNPGGGGHSGTEGGRTLVTHFAEEGSFLKTSACPRFCKRRVLFCTQVRSMGVKIPLQSTKYTRLWRRVNPEVSGLPSLLPPLAAAKHAEDYKIES